MARAHLCRIFPAFIPVGDQQRDNHVFQHASMVFGPQFFGFISGEKRPERKTAVFILNFNLQIPLFQPVRICFHPLAKTILQRLQTFLPRLVFFFLKIAHKKIRGNAFAAFQQRFGSKPSFHSNGKGMIQQHISVKLNTDNRQPGYHEQHNYKHCAFFIMLFLPSQFLHSLQKAGNTPPFPLPSPPCEN